MNISKWVAENSATIVILSIGLPILAFEMGECATLISRAMVNSGAWFLGVITTREIGQTYLEEWSALVTRFPGKLTKILLTFSILARAIPQLWWVLVGEEIPANVGRACKVRFVRWQRANNSPKPGVQVARLDRGHVAIKSARSTPRILVFSLEDMREFLARIYNGEFDIDAAA
jgi:hypothetical protein